MAGMSCRSPPLPLSLVLKPAPALQIKPLCKIMMLKPTKLSVNRTLQIASSIRNNLVFEDRSNGVICYRDDDGEIICEGYDDEEPRLHQEIEKAATESYPRSDGEVKIDHLLLHRSWDKRLETVNGGAGSGRGDLGANGYSLNMNYMSIITAFAGIRFL